MVKVAGVNLPIEDAFAPIVKLAANAGFKLALNALYERNEKVAKLTAVELYAAMDAYVEDMVESTPGPLDDAVIEGIMEAIEKFAEQVHIKLPELG